MCKQNSLSEKISITLPPVLEDDHTSDSKRILFALKEKGYDHIVIPLSILQKLYPLTRPETKETEYTISLVHTRHGQEEDRLVITDVEKGDKTRQHYGIAVDYGSTTILFQLVNITTGEVLFECREMNLQRKYGTDILTRIIYGLESEAHKKDLHKVTVDTFHRGFAVIKEATGIDPAACPCMVISGNTTMVHFLLTLDAWTVFASPFAPVTMDPGFFSGKELDLAFDGQVFIMPSASNYIGGDIVSGLLTIDLQKKDELGVFFDVGTNGELVMGNKDFLIAGAGAAGPALEGYISKYGTTAKPGAIDTVRIENGEMITTTIDNAAPIGICGSGIIDLLSEMRLNGWVDIAGVLDPSASDRIKYVKNEETGESEYACIYAWPEESASHEALFFSQTDITQYIETKAAAHTMVDCLLDAAGMTEADIDHMYLTGAFCTHSNLESAITIGMFPDLPRNRYTGLRNSSLDGARTLLLDRCRMADIDTLLETIYCVQFASMPDFMIRMQASKFIPHTNMRQYPSVEEKLSVRNKEFCHEK